MFAVFASGGKQHRVTEGEVVRLELVGGEPGEQVVFDKAAEAASAEKIRHAIEQVDAALEALDKEADANPAEREALERKKARLLEQLNVAEEAFKALELAEKDGG